MTMKEKFVLKLCKNTLAKSIPLKLSELVFKCCCYKSDLLILCFYILLCNGLTVCYICVLICNIIASRKFYFSKHNRISQTCRK